MNPIDVLVVDSDAHSLQATLGMLGARFHIADTARSGYEAVAKAYICHPQVVLTEVEMESPRAGLLALREITGSLRNCRVILYTSVREEETICRAFADGASDYLFKPAAAAALVRAVVSAGTGACAVSADGGEVLLRDYRRLRHLHENLSGLLRIAMTLTNSELNILRLLAGGMQPGEIERVRFIEHSTMKTHLSHIIRKFDMDSLSQVVETLQAFQFFQFLDE